MPFLLLAILLVGAGLAAGLGLSEAPRGRSNASFGGDVGVAASRTNTSTWLRQSVERLLLDYGPYTEKDYSKMETVHFTRTSRETYLKANEAGEPSAPNRMIYWVIVSGGVNFRDDAAFVPLGANVPSGNVLVFVFDATTLELTDSGIIAGPSSAAALRTWLAAPSTSWSTFQMKLPHSHAVAIATRGDPAT